MVIGFLNDRTHSPTASFGFIALAYLAAATLILSLRICNPLILRSDESLSLPIGVESPQLGTRTPLQRS